MKPSTQLMRRNIIENFRSRSRRQAAEGSRPRSPDGPDRCQGEHAARRQQSAQGAAGAARLCRVIDMIDSNPAIGVKKYKGGGDGFHSWTEDEIARFEERHPIGTRARLAFSLLLSPPNGAAT